MLPKKVRDVWLLTRLSIGNGGSSMIIDPYGKIIKEANGSSPRLVTGPIDIMDLRDKRKRWLKGGVGNYLARRRTEMYEPHFRRTIFPPNGILKDGSVKRGTMKPSPGEETRRCGA